MKESHLVCGALNMVGISPTANIALDPSSGSELQAAPSGLKRSATAGDISRRNCSLISTYDKLDWTYIPAEKNEATMAQTNRNVDVSWDRENAARVPGGPCHEVSSRGVHSRWGCQADPRTNQFAHRVNEIMCHNTSTPPVTTSTETFTLKRRAMDRFRMRHAAPMPHDEPHVGHAMDCQDSTGALESDYSSEAAASTGALASQSDVSNAPASPAVNAPISYRGLPGRSRNLARRAAPLSVPQGVLSTSRHTAQRQIAPHARAPAQHSSPFRPNRRTPGGPNAITRRHPPGGATGGGANSARNGFGTCSRFSSTAGHAGTDPRSNKVTSIESRVNALEKSDAGRREKQGSRTEGSAKTTTSDLIVQLEQRLAKLEQLQLAVETETSGNTRCMQGHASIQAQEPRSYASNLHIPRCELSDGTPPPIQVSKSLPQFSGGTSSGGCNYNEPMSLPLPTHSTACPTEVIVRRSSAPKLQDIYDDMDWSSLIPEVAGRGLEPPPSKPPPSTSPPDTFEVQLPSETSTAFPSNSIGQSGLTDSSPSSISGRPFSENQSHHPMTYTGYDSYCGWDSQSEEIFSLQTTASSVQRSTGRRTQSEGPSVDPGKAKVSLASKPISMWDEDDVVMWLAQFSDLPTDMRRVVHENAINGRVLFSMKEEDVASLTHIKYGHRKILALGASELRSAWHAPARNTWWPWGRDCCFNRST